MNVDATAHEIARKLNVSSLEVERVIEIGVEDTGDNLSFLRVGKVVVADGQFHGDLADGQYLKRRIPDDIRARGNANGDGGA